MTMLSNRQKYQDAVALATGWDRTNIAPCSSVGIYDYGSTNSLIPSDERMGDEDFYDIQGDECMARIRQI